MLWTQYELATEEGEMQRGETDFTQDNRKDLSEKVTSKLKPEKGGGEQF